MLRLLGLAGLLLLPQAQAPPTTLDEPITLHAYSTLVQIPVLVLSNQRLRAPTLTPDQFTLNIDGGPYFAPKRVRQESSDAIRLVLLLDITPDTASSLSTFGPALEDLSTSLTTKDVVSVSVLRGASLASTQDAPLTPARRASIGAFVADQFATGRSSSGPAPGAASYLWNAVALSLDHFGQTTSRRVLLVVTDRKQRDTNAIVRQLRTAATSLGVTIFALREQPATEARNNNVPLSRDAFGYARPEREGGDALVALTELTGGVTLETYGHPLAEGLMRVLRMARERYILDFAMPSKLGQGIHVLDVRTRQKNLFVRAGGTSAPMPDPAIANDPNTVHSDHPDEPPVGTRKVMR